MRAPSPDGIDLGRHSGTLIPPACSGMRSSAWVVGVWSDRYCGLLVRREEDHACRCPHCGDIIFHSQNCPVAAGIGASTTIRS